MTTHGSRVVKIRLSRVVNFRLSFRKNREDKAFEAFWNGYLRLFNLYQFLPGAMFAVSEDFESSVYEREPPKRPEACGEAERWEKGESHGAAWEEVRDLADPSLRDFLHLLKKQGAILPEAGFELADERGEVVAEAELAWPRQKISVVASRQAACQGVFEQAGWRAYRMQDVVDAPEKVMGALGQ